MERGLPAILIADAVGYSRLSHVDEEGTRTRFLAHLKEIFEPKIFEHRGRLVKTMGNGMLVEFADADQALGYAHGLKGELKQAKVQFDEALRIAPHSFDILADYAC